MSNRQREAAIRVLGGIERRTFGIETADVLRRPGRLPPSGVASKREMHVHRVHRLDDALLETSPIPRDRWAVLPERLARGDVGYLAVDDASGHVLGWSWYTRSSLRDPWSGLNLRLAPDEAYFYDTWVDAGVRRSGAATFLKLSQLGDLVQRGDVRWIYVVVAKDNHASQAVNRRLGFESYQNVSYARVLQRWGWQVPLADRPRFGPCSPRGRHDSRGEALPQLTV